MPYEVQHPGDGTRIELGPNEIVIRLSGDDTGGAFSVCEYTAPPDGPSPPPHIHEQTDEGFYVLDGTLECTIEDDTLRAPAGTTLFVPRGTVHTFAPTGSGPARVLLVYAPAGFERYFAAMGEFLQSLPPGPPPQAKVQQKAAELSERYDQTLVDTE